MSASPALRCAVRSRCPRVCARSPPSEREPSWRRLAAVRIRVRCARGPRGRTPAPVPSTPHEAPRTARWWRTTFPRVPPPGSRSRLRRQAGAGTHSASGRRTASAASRRPRGPHDKARRCSCRIRPASTRRRPAPGRGRVRRRPAGRATLDEQSSRGISHTSNRQTEVAWMPVHGPPHSVDAEREATARRVAATHATDDHGPDGIRNEVMHRVVGPRLVAHHVEVRPWQANDVPEDLWADSERDCEAHTARARGRGVDGA